MLEMQRGMHVISSYSIQGREMEDLHLSWAAIESACKSLAEDIKAQKVEFECIVAIAKGGFIPAVLVDDFLGLNIPIFSVHISSYHSEDRTQSKITFRTQLAADYVMAGTALIIDDIADSGETMKAIPGCRDHPSNCFKAVLVTKPLAIPHVSTYSIKVPQDWWVVFPWENEDDGNGRARRD